MPFHLWSKFIRYFLFTVAAAVDSSLTEEFVLFCTLNLIIRIFTIICISYDII